MTTLTADERATLTKAAATNEAWRRASAAYWESRAQDFERALPRPGDYLGRSTPEERAERAARIRAQAAACRLRATGLDGWADAVLAETAHTLLLDEPLDTAA